MKNLNTGGHRIAGRILALIAFAFAMPVDANAQWDVIQLHPNGASRSWAYGVGDGGQVGFAEVGGVSRASLWNGSANSWADLHPAGADSSSARSVDGGQQMGSAVVGGVPLASLWSGTAASWVDLTPYWAGATQSTGSGLGGGEQVGSATMGGVSHASLWTGTAASWVDLHPFGATSSGINATDGVQQVGVATVGGSWRASLWWFGFADSWEDLTPAGAWGSRATGVGDGQQVGYVWLGDSPASPSSASLWSGTAASWVDLSPAGTSNWSSRAYAVHGGEQVGDVGVRACMWSGTPESWVDLHAFLPSKFTTSVALGIWHDATYAYVVGWGNNSKRNRQEALMWRADYSPPSEPGAVTVDDISPNTMDAGAVINVTITGSGFEPGATVTLENGAGPAPAAGVTYVSLDGLTIDATIAAPGGGPQGMRVWDVRVTNTDSSTDVLADAFTVVK
jgi:hypothetical protein